MPMGIAYPYESRWIVYSLLEVLQGPMDSITLRQPCIINDMGFTLSSAQKHLYYHVKGEAPSGLWTIADLSYALLCFRQEFHEEVRECILASPSAVNQLSSLVDGAHCTETWSEFDSEILSIPHYVVSTNSIAFQRRDAPAREDFSRLLACWQDYSPESAYQALKRIRIRIIDHRYLTEQIGTLAERLIAAPQAKVLDALFHYEALFMANRTPWTLTCEAIWNYLEGCGFKRRSEIQEGRKKLVCIDEITQFKRIRSISRSAITADILAHIRRLDEKDEIERFLREILRDSTQTPHTSTEIADILTTQIDLAGELHLTAFINKGRSWAKVTAKEVSHQFLRLRQIPHLDLIVFLAVGHIQDDAKRDFLTVADLCHAKYMIVDAEDVARLFIAYNKICAIHGVPFVNGQCRACITLTS